MSFESECVGVLPIDANRAWFSVYLGETKHEIVSKLFDQLTQYDSIEDCIISLPVKSTDKKTLSKYMAGDYGIGNGVVFDNIISVVSKNLTMKPIVKLPNGKYAFHVQSEFMIARIS